MLATQVHQDHSEQLRKSFPQKLFRFAPLAAWAALGMGIAYVLAFDPTDATPDLTGPCVWHATFGMDGPSCGITRMMWYVLHGDLVQAARHHLAAFIALPGLLYALVWWTAYELAGRRLPALRLPAWVYIAYGVLFLVYAAVLRNLPWEPFSWFYVENLT